MPQDGARFSKLKEVFKRAIQEILKDEETVLLMAISPDLKDSFYSESTVQTCQEDVKQVFTEIKSKFTEVFKNKIRTSNLDIKLNNLDKDIKDNRVNNKDIKNENYIKEIFESHITDLKEDFVKTLEQNISEPENKIIEISNEIEKIEENIKKLEVENLQYENDFQNLVSEMESVVLK